MARIGVQAMMLRQSVAEIGAYETFKLAQGIGYQVAELSQIPMTAETVSQLRRAQDDFGIEYCALSAALSSGGANDSLEEHFDKIVAEARLLGAGLVRIGMLPVPALRSVEAITEFCRRADSAAVRLADEGIALYYHNHHVEFTKIDGTYLLDLIAELSPNVGFELDAHWIQRGGKDPARLISSFSGRVRMVHLKDYRIAMPSSEAIDAFERGDHATWSAEWNGLVQFAEVGEGTLDWPGIITASLDAGAEYLLVEQDELYGRTVWEALATSRAHLVALGYADMF